MKWIRLLLIFYVAFVVLVSLIPSNGFSFWHVDKIGHFVAYFGMTILAFLAFPSKGGHFLSVVFIIGLGILLEWGQSFVPGRDTSLLDGIVNALGVITGVIFFRFRGHILTERF